MKSNSSLENKNVVEYTICIDNVQFTLLYDIGFLNSLSSAPKPQNRTLLHFHEYYELVFCGCPTELTTDDSTTVCAPGQIVITPPKKLHKRTPLPCETTENTTATASVSFAMKKLSHSSQLHLFEILEVVLSDVCIFDSEEKYSHLISRFDLDNPDTVAGDVLSMSLLLHQLINHIVKSVMPALPKNAFASVSDSDTTRTYKLNMLICACYHQNISKEYVAKKLNMSVRQLSRVVKASYNCSFHEIITKFRMEEAAQLLKNSKMSIASIAFDVGYNSSKSFDNAFKKFYGMLPSEYRKQ